MFAGFCVIFIITLYLFVLAWQERVIREAMQTKMEENNRAYMEQIKELKEVRF